MGILGGKKDEEKSTRKITKIVKEVLAGKESGRKVFGFLCSPAIPASIKMQADQLHVPMFALAEHALQLGAQQIQAAVMNPDERELLYAHLTEVHVGMRTIEKVDKYDREQGDVLMDARNRRFAVEKATRQLVLELMASGLRPEDLIGYVKLGMQAQIAANNGRPLPPEMPRRTPRYQPPTTPPPPDDKADNTDNINEADKE